MNRKLTQQQVDAYERDGFVSPIEIFSNDVAARLRAQFERAQAKWPDAFDGAARNNAHYNITVLDEIVHNETLLDAVEDLIGPNILNYGTVLFVKEAHDPGFVSWHQDARYMGLDPPIGVTAWIALSPSNAKSGCMRMIPGSHRNALYRHTDTFREHNLLTRGQEIGSVDETTAVDITLEPGQASFHSMRVIHGSQPNHSHDRRLGFAIQCFVPPDVVQTKARTYAQLARGRDGYGNFEPAPRPARDMAPDDVALRDTVNTIWRDILYDGAGKHRDL